MTGGWDYAFFVCSVAAFSPLQLDPASPFPLRGMSDASSRYICGSLSRVRAG